MKTIVFTVFYEDGEKDKYISSHLNEHIALKVADSYEGWVSRMEEEICDYSIAYLEKIDKMYQEAMDRVKELIMEVYLET